MFWKINFKPSSAIDGLLDKEDCTLNEILDEDDVLTEVKSQNKKLIDFIQKPENLEQLVKYACVLAEPDTEDKYRFKYPHLACEILTADVFVIVETLSTVDQYLPMLWQFLYDEPPLNPLIGSFNSKILAMLLGQRTTIFLSYIQKIEGFVDHFLQHLGTSAMMDLLLQMIAAPEGDQNRIDVAMWLSEEGIIRKLVDFIRPSTNMDQCINSSQALCDMIRITRESAQLSGPSPLLITLESEETIKRLIDNMFETDDPPDWVIVNGTSILLTALEKKIYGGYSPTLGRSFQPPPVMEENPSADQAIERILTNIIPSIKSFHNLLSRRPQCEVMVTTVGTLDPPLGNMRLQVVRLFSALLNTHDMRVQREIILHSTCTVLMDLFFQYPWNNFLHTQVEACINAALSSTNPVTLELDSGTGQANDSSTLRQHILTESKLVQRLLDGAEHNERILSEENGSRLGYMGHLVRMANQLSGNERAIGIGGGVLDHSREIVGGGALIGNERLQGELDQDTYQKWSDFITGPIAEMNKKNDTNLGGSRPLTSSIDDSDEEFDSLNMGPDNELEKAFQQYQDSRFSTVFMEDFGLDDNLDPAPISYAATYQLMTTINCSIEANEVHTQYMAGFEATCAERIHPFDDSESDEEEESSPWAEKDISFASSLGGPRSPHSSTSDEDEDDDEKERKGGRIEYPTESSDDEDNNTREKIIIVEGRQDSNEANEIGVISWRSEFSTDEDLSRVNPPNDWTKEPAQDEKWADFTSVTFGKDEVKEDTPRVVSVTYVSVKELEAQDNTTNTNTSYTRLSEGGEEDSIGSIGSDEGGIIVDNNLLSMSQRTYSESSDEDDVLNSSDEDRSANYSLTEGESSNPLLNASDTLTNDISTEESEESSKQEQDTTTTTTARTNEDSSNDSNSNSSSCSSTVEDKKIKEETSKNDGNANNEGEESSNSMS